MILHITILIDIFPIMSSLIVVVSSVPIAWHLLLYLAMCTSPTEDCCQLLIVCSVQDCRNHAQVST